MNHQRCTGCGAIFPPGARGIRCTCDAGPVDAPIVIPTQPIKHEVPRVDRERLANRHAQCRGCVFYEGAKSFANGADCRRFSCHRGYESHLLYREWPAEVCKLRRSDAKYHGPFVIAPEPLPEPKSNLAIVCIAVGDRVREHWEITNASHREYANRIGADYHVLTDDLCPSWPLGNKTRVSRYASIYERTLLLDSDVWIQPHAPDIFQATPADAFCAHDEWPDQRPEIGTEWIVRESIEVAISQGYRPTPINWEPNAGVMIIPKQLAHIFRTPTKAYPINWCAEQHYLALAIREDGCGYHNLDPRWNWCWIRPNWMNGFENAWFIHPNGMPNRERVEFLRSLAR